jgi:hypothetical protein
MKIPGVAGACLLYVYVSVKLQLRPSKLMIKMTPTPAVKDDDDENYAAKPQAPPLRRDNLKDDPRHVHGQPGTKKEP